MSAGHGVQHIKIRLAGHPRLRRLRVGEVVQVFPFQDGFVVGVYGQGVNAPLRRQLLFLDRYELIHRRMADVAVLHIAHHRRLLTC